MRLVIKQIAAIARIGLPTIPAIFGGVSFHEHDL